MTPTTPSADADLELLERIRAKLRAGANPARSPRMQAYMKSAMPYLGVSVPEVRRIARAEARARPASSVTALGHSSAALWRHATYREERYAATALTGLPLAIGQLELLGLHHEMIVTGAWWDHVDEVAHRIGGLLGAHPGHMGPVIRAWSHDPDRWLRRVSIISQLNARRATDLALLGEVIVSNSADRDFFVRKAIGWALRNYAYTDPDWVLGFVAALDMSPLSRREALKHLQKENS